MTTINPTASNPTAINPTASIAAGNGTVGRTAVRPRLWRAGLTAGVVAAVATTITAVTAHAAGVPLTIGGEAIPAAGFAQLTMVGALLGLLLARLARRFTDPRTVFVRTTVVLTALSIVPDVLVDATVASRLVLAATHVLAAVIIVPTLARRLAR